MGQVDSVVQQFTKVFEQIETERRNCVRDIGDDIRNAVAGLKESYNNITIGELDNTLEGMATREGMQAIINQIIKFIEMLETVRKKGVEEVGIKLNSAVGDIKGTLGLSATTASVENATTMIRDLQASSKAAADKTSVDITTAGNSQTEGIKALETSITTLTGACEQSGKDTAASIKEARSAAADDASRIKVAIEGLQRGGVMTDMQEKQRKVLQEVGDIKGDVDKLKTKLSDAKFAAGEDAKGVKEAIKALQTDGIMVDTQDKQEKVLQDVGGIKVDVAGLKTDAATKQGIVEIQEKLGQAIGATETVGKK